MLHNVIEWLKLYYDQYGYLIVFLSTLSENTALLGLVLPGNSLALLGAFYARIGTLNLGLVIFFATMGTIADYHVDYLLGRFALKGPCIVLGIAPWGVVCALLLVCASLVLCYTSMVVRLF
ncbi:hypothetical protein [Ktedonobacter racemifer]|uniref:hypothetical protein n=1 Tax=Ktedonobacter racemifer TaxID=363277 RepID=UPI0005907AF7|nr:hypothetical protein [Ktedonobacter racemifer]